MSFCINYWCSSRENPNVLQHCNSCGTPLIINNRYRILRSLRDSSSLTEVYYEVFEIQNLDNGERNVLKTLVRSNDNKLKELFDREIEVLLSLNDSRVPKGKDLFSLDIHSPCRRELPCLVMEYIEGMNLDEWIKHNGKVTDESKALDWLKQLTILLGLIHANNLFHRDIKPSNIMRRARVAEDELVIIDFGTVKQSETAAKLQKPTRFDGSLGYTPREVQEGKPVAQSDFFALARTFVYLLTGVHPYEYDSVLKDWKWRSQFPQSKLMELIDDMMKEQPTDRPSSAEEILHRIDEIRNTKLSPPPSQPPPTQTPAWLLPLAGVSGLLFVAFIMWNILPIQCWRLHGLFSKCVTTKSDNPAKLDNPAKDLISSGERQLIGLRLDYKYAQWKSKGIEEFKAAAAQKKDYQDAINNFEAIRNEATTILEQAKNGVNTNQYEQALARTALKDAEVLIYLNNSKVRQNARINPNIFTIAVAAPLNLDAGLHILQGVAQAQNEVNQNQPFLEVVIANDDNNTQRAKDIAEALAENQKILAVVGHYTSEVTREAMSKYQEKGKGLVVVSPTSTSTFLSETYAAQHIFFRTASSTAVEGKSLAEYANKIRAKKIIIFRSNGEFSKSLTRDFTRFLGADTILKTYNIDSESINRLQSIGVSNTDALAVFTNGQIDNYNDFDIAINLINNYLRQDSKKKILGSNSLFLWGTLNSYIKEDVKKSIVCRLIIGVDWVFKPGSRSTFTWNAAKYWGGAVNFRTALANDAVQVLVAAWQPGAGRLDIQKKLSSNPPFSVGDNGYGKIATGDTTGDRKVSFSPNNGDREEIKGRILVTPASFTNEQVFVPLEEPDTNCPQ